MKVLLYTYKIYLRICLYTRDVRGTTAAQQGGLFISNAPRVCQKKPDNCGACQKKPRVCQKKPDSS